MKLTPTTVALTVAFATIPASAIAQTKQDGAKSIDPHKLVSTALVAKTMAVNLIANIPQDIVFKMKFPFPTNSSLSGYSENDPSQCRKNTAPNLASLALPYVYDGFTGATKHDLYGQSARLMTDLKNTSICLTEVSRN